MKAGLAANIALTLVVVGWASAFWGGMSQIGDYAPSVSQERIMAMHRLSMLVLCGGVLCLIAALWLSGYSFSAAKNRATLAALAVIIPFIIIFAGLFK